MQKRKLHVFLEIRTAFVVALLSVAVGTAGCGPNQTTSVVSQQTAANAGGLVREGKSTDESVFEAITESAAEGYEEGLAEVLAKAKQDAADVQDDAEKDAAEDDGESKKDAADGDDGKGKKDAADGDDVANQSDGAPEESAQETPEEISAPPAGSMFDTSADTAEVATSVADATDTSGSEEYEGAPVTYYDRAQASEETVSAVTDVVTAETGGSAGYIQSFQNKVIDLVNAERARVGLSALAWDSGAQQVANIRAAELVSYADHTRPNGGAWYTVFGEYNIQPVPSGAGENIAGGQITPEEVMAEWLHSVGHYANIIRPEFTGIGVACYFDPNSTYKFQWVQTFVTR